MNLVSLGDHLESMIQDMAKAIEECSLNFLTLLLGLNPSVGKSMKKLVKCRDEDGGTASYEISVRFVKHEIQ